MPKKEEKEITPEQTVEKKPITTDEETNRLFEGEDIEDLVSESPIVSGADVEKDKEMAKKAGEETTEQVEKAKKEETTETKEEKDEKSQETVKKESSTEEKTSQEPDQVTPEKVKIGDREVSPEEVALWESEFNKKAKWEDDLSKKSMIAASLNDDEIQAATQVVSGERKLPDQSAELADRVFSDITEDKPVKIKDEKDGYEIDITDQVKEKVQEAVKATLKVVDPYIKKLEKTNEDSQRKAGSVFITGFMNNHPDYKIVPPKGIPIDVYMDKVQRVGPTHPDYAAVARCFVLSDSAKRMGYVGPDSLEQAYTFMHGKYEGKVKTAEEKAVEAADAQAKIIKKQEKVVQETTGKQVETKDDLTELMDDLEDPADKALKAIGV